MGVFLTHSRVCLQTYWHFKARIAGHSNDVVEWFPYDTDTIIIPGNSYRDCFIAPVIRFGSTPNLIWEAIRIEAEFK